jgi:hypothetical protein
MKTSLIAFARLAGAGLALAAAAVAPASAHHSAAIYDRAHPITLKGVIKELQWMNPHGWIEVIAQDGSKTTAWTIEMEGPNVMQREGWSRHSLLPGDRVTAVVMPLKDGRPGARLVEVTKADGTTLHLFTPRAGGV